VGGKGCDAISNENKIVYVGAAPFVPPRISAATRVLRDTKIAVGVAPLLHSNANRRHQVALVLLLLQQNIFKNPAQAILTHLFGLGDALPVA
jgi:hypothetical protein